MENSIRLHKKHGLNPTMCQCFWCGESTGEIALLGDLYKDKAPIKMITNYEPCEKCEELFNQGILIIEVSMTPNTHKQPELNGAYPTGQHWVVTEDAITRLLNETASQEILKARKCLITHQDAIDIGLFSPKD
jgi:hypothetical protein